MSRLTKNAIDFRKFEIKGRREGDGEVSAQIIMYIRAECHVVNRAAKCSKQHYKRRRKRR